MRGPERESKKILFICHTAMYISDKGRSLPQEVLNLNISTERFYIANVIIIISDGLGSNPHRALLGVLGPNLTISEL